ncbi:MAG: LLM class F420-dependent oxidoreductase [Gammaproteobacteria bacterium]|nr:LLM class F420-dependent oxidoreductase [Gammaproteobacteria bacterium]
MRFGFYLPTRGEWANPDALASFAQCGDRLGFSSVMIADHLVFPVRIESKYPYTVDGSFPGHGDAFDQLSLMAFIAAKTERLRLVSSVMILPHRNPLVTAKMLATIDVLSKGRVTVGVGVGWLREEFQALDAPDFDLRGAVSDEYLEIFKKCWTEDPVSHDGEFYSFNEVRCLPHPVQKPHPPIWVGGHSRPALRRAARYGDGWHPVGAIAAVPLPPAEMQGKIDELRRMAERHGRDPQAITISYKAPHYDTSLPVPGTQRKPFTGAPDQIAADVRAYEAVGISELVFDFRAPTVEESLERMGIFAETVMAITA